MFGGLDEVLQRQDGFGFEGRSPRFSTLRFGGFDAVFGALRDEAAFDVGNGSKDVKDQFTGSGCRVEPVQAGDLATEFLIRG